MLIELENVIPAPMAGISYDPGSIWGKSVSFNSGDYVIVKAASGKGKSTLVSLLYGLRNDYSGTITVDGKNIRSYSLGDW